MRDSARAALRAIGRAAPAAAAVGLLLAFNAGFTPGFFDLTVVDGRLAGSLVDVLNRGAVVALLALGMALVIATGGVDLSVGAVMAIAGATAATLVAQHGASPWAAVAGALAVGAAAGAFNGALVAVAGVQPIVATLVLMVAGRGAAQLLTGGQIITFNDPVLNFIDGGFVAGVPMPVLIGAGALALGLALTRGTALGLFIEATGDNERAARLAGVRVRIVKASAYALCGVGSAVAGLLAVSDIRAADANNAGLYLELDAILAAVLGGTSLRGGRFSLVGAVLGALFIQGLTTTLYLHDVSPNATLAVKAGAVLAVCLAVSERVRAWVKWK
ncbi:MAG TPA: ABC transporter permease [Phycisphaerales bacterium]|nr:ABC transporter permease [Phycisphaerales bacterium]